MWRNIVAKDEQLEQIRNEMQSQKSGGSKASKRIASNGSRNAQNQGIYSAKAAGLFPF